MKSSAAFIVAFAAFAAAAPAAHAANLCMSAPLASFDGYGAMSPDGHYLVAGDRLMSLPDLRELGRVPSGGVRTFSADSRRFLVLDSQDGRLDIVDVAGPSAPRRLTFSSQSYAQLSPNGTVLLIHPAKRDVPDPQALDGKDTYLTTQFLRTADGSAIAQINRGFEDLDWALDASERHIIVFSHNIASKAGEVDLIDASTGQMRQLNVGLTDGDVDMAPDGTVAVTTDFNNYRTTFWDVSTGNSLGSVGTSGRLWLSKDSNWFFIENVALKRGNWTTPYRLQIDKIERIEPRDGRLVIATKDGTIAAVDANLQPLFHSPSLGERVWQTPQVSPGNEYVAWSSDANDVEEDKVVGSSNLAVLDGHSGALVCRRTLAQPADFHVLGVTATHVVVQESVSYKNPVVKLYAIENEAAAQARLQRENVQAKAQSAKLSPAKRAEAQATFKQAFELFQSGEFATAARLFETGLAIDPGNAVASYYLGETYARLGDKDHAAVYYRRAADIAPGTKEGALAVTRLSN